MVRIASNLGHYWWMQIRAMVIQSIGGSHYARIGISAADGIRKSGIWSLLGMVL
jgi:hypothetical protein